MRPAIAAVTSLLATVALAGAPDLCPVQLPDLPLARVAVDDAVASLRLKSGTWMILRPIAAGEQAQRFEGSEPHTTVRFRPGERRISLGGDDWENSYCFETRATFEPGHVYLLGFKGYHRGLFGDYAQIWIEDTLTGTIIAGSKPKALRRLGQDNPPGIGFRGRVQLSWDDECRSLDGPLRRAVVLKRREMIIELGDRWMASPIGKVTGTLGELLEYIAALNEYIFTDTCPVNDMPTDPKWEHWTFERYDSSCDRIRFSLHKFIARVEAKAERGKLDDETAADLIARARTLLRDFVGTERQIDETVGENPATPDDD